MSGEIVLDEVARVVDEIAAQAQNAALNNNEVELVKDQQLLEPPKLADANHVEEKLVEVELDSKPLEGLLKQDLQPFQEKVEQVESKPLEELQSPSTVILDLGEQTVGFQTSSPLKVEIQPLPRGEELQSQQSREVPQEVYEQGLVQSPVSFLSSGTTSPCSPEDSTSPHICVKPRRRPKCHVHFADEKGKELAKARECPPSDVPPDLDVQAILKDAYVPPQPLFGGPMGMWSMRSNSTEKPIGKWAYAETTQPMDDYAVFARTMEQQLILAENVFLNNDKLICTVKVKCIKQVLRVFARITFNNWISFDDIDCNLIPMAGLGGPQIASILYQRYVFERVLPPVPTSIEPSICTGTSIMFCFCVVYTDREERWDNHFGRNYVVECVPLDPAEEAALMAPPSTDMPAFNVVGHHFRPPPPLASSGVVVTEEEKRYNKQLRAMSPDYTYYNESTEFYW